VRPYLLLLMLVVAPGLCLAEPSRPNQLQDLISNTRALRRLVQSDPHRPIYHFVAPEGHAMPFDPNGAIYWKGKYHLGFIYLKRTAGKERFAWGHIVSSDLLHWTIYPDMLEVGEGEDEWGIYSGGSFVSKENVPHIIYYDQGTASNRVAYATDDDLKVWKKGGAVLSSATPDDDRSSAMICCLPPKGRFSVFDPDAWYDEGAGYYYQISGGMKPGLFKSADMREWQYLGSPVGADDSARLPIEDLSCPDFFSLGTKSMLLFISHARGAQYYIGSFANDRFTPERHGRMNWPGGTFFAPEQLRDDQGRNIIWGWVIQPKHGARGWQMRQKDGAPPPRDYGWSGVMSLPRVLSLDKTGQLQISPPEEIKRLRLREVKQEAFALQSNQEMTLDARGRSIELKIEIAGGSRSPFGIKVFASPDGREETVIRYEPEHEHLVIDFVRSAVSGPVEIEFVGAKTTDMSKPVIERVSQQRAPFKLTKGEALTLNVFLDRSIIEVFANGRQAVTQVVYPELETSDRVKVFSGNEAVTVKNVQSWTMAETNAY
jgi:beta-fructofuranosidase